MITFAELEKEEKELTRKYQIAAGNLYHQRRFDEQDFAVKLSDALKSDFLIGLTGYQVLCFLSWCQKYGVEKAHTLITICGIAAKRMEESRLSTDDGEYFIQ